MKMHKQNVLNRIIQMEFCMDHITEALQYHSPDEILKNDSCCRMLDELNEYMNSGQWLSDYEADEEGIFPADLKRGVLSQDALFDLLAQFRF